MDYRLVSQAGFLVLLITQIDWFIFHLVNLRGELTPTELGADAAAGFELKRLLYQATLIIED